MHKEWRVDIAPLLFFAAVVAVKVYYLFVYIAAAQPLLDVMQDDSRRAAAGSALTYQATTQFSHLGYFTVSLAFDALVFYSLLVRRAAKERPRGFMENIFPLITVFVPVAGFTLMFLPQVRAMLPGYPEGMLAWLNELTPLFPFYINLAGLVIGLFGAAFSIWAIAHLRASFGLRTAVRELVTSGPYRRIRHPLYFGEIVHIFGIVVLAATPAALSLFIVAVALQAVRAKVEERKFLASVPAYAEFQRNTGFLWPKLR
ncbi:MAG: isoprenylcysteine carboxylmethyltransferase family protein [Gammaproteobacteria bacterium]|nr:isoprenylcysteine carboxylmethyltransferase family protein [Gammaproteobacteria bacterium]MCB1925026.1 isoprenylcysteine carboxylmethyltransferase family protein [Gammaproteobacteria bacterium]